MHNDPIYLLKPVFDWLDGLIRDQGDSRRLRPPGVSALSRITLLS